VDAEVAEELRLVFARDELAHAERRDSAFGRHGVAHDVEFDLADHRHELRELRRVELVVEIDEALAAEERRPQRLAFEVGRDDARLDDEVHRAVVERRVVEGQ
jgi:hypothetical protein